MTGEKAAGKDASTSATSAALQKQKVGPVITLTDGAFSDYRWEDGRWVLSYFTGLDNKVDWDSVIDAEIERRKLLEDTPVASLREDPVNFDTSEIPWWAWVRRFHLPEAEKLNGRAAMVGYALAWFVDSLSGYGIVDQQNSFLGKLLLHIAVFAILIFRNLDSIPSYRNLLNEATFYDKQWAATWAGQDRPVESEQ